MRPCGSHRTTYQRFAIDFIKEHTNAAVFLDMGLGKTVITLTALDALLFDSFEVSRVLVVCPLRVAKTTWPQEIAKWDHLRHLRYSVVVGTPKERVRRAEQTGGTVHHQPGERGVAGQTLRRAKDAVRYADY